MQPKESEHAFRAFGAAQAQRGAGPDVHSAAKIERLQAQGVAYLLLNGGGTSRQNPRRFGDAGVSGQ